MFPVHREHDDGIIALSVARRPEIMRLARVWFLCLVASPTACFHTASGPVARNFGDGVGNIVLRLNAIEFACLDDGIDGGGAFSTDL